MQIITLPAEQNIYMLWKKLKEDEFNTDIIEVLRENSSEIRAQLEGLERDDFSEVYLFFDYDGHQNNLKDNENNGNNVLLQMLKNFSNETENGKLYISYPMAEALRDFEEGVCGRKTNCYVALNKLADYKKISGTRAMYQQFRDYDYVVWKSAMEVFVMKLSCLMNQNRTISYKEYTEKITPCVILEMETMEINRSRVFVLSAFPEFLLDYFGEKLWKTTVKRSANYFSDNSCGYDGNTITKIIDTG